MKTIRISIPFIWILFSIQTALCDVPFSVSPSDYEYWGAITAIVYDVNNEHISDTGDTIAAFVGDECRGVAIARHLPKGTRFFLQVWSNDPGETISFQFFDAATQTIHKVQEIITFSSGMLMGNIDTPHFFHLKDPILKGCIDPKAQNYDPMAGLDDNSCIYAPELNDIDNQIIDEDTALVYTLTASDGDNDPLTFTTQISNTSFDTTIEHQTLIVTPPPNFFGTADLSVSVTDGKYSDTCKFQLIVSSVNDPPVISEIPDQIVYENESTSAIYFTVKDIENDTYQVSVQSSNTDLVNDHGVVLTVDQWFWYLTLTPISNAWGESRITVTVNDGHDSVDESFLLTVRPLTVQPIISDIPTVIIQENSASEWIPFTVTDYVYSEAFLELTVSTSSPQLIPINNIEMVKNYEGRFLRLTPIIDQCGSTTITLKASNPKYSVNSVFTVFVQSKDEIAIFKRFQKLDDLGNPLADNATEFTMVHDLITDLIWEVKPENLSLQSNDRLFTWYDSDNATNGGFAGTTTPSGDTEFYIIWLNNQDGPTNWRMPEISELMSLINITKNSPHISKQFFPNTQSGCYWSASSHAQYPGNAWIVDFSDGTDDYISKAHNCYIRAVRGKADDCLLKPDRFVDNQDETITDTCTGYMWAKDVLGKDSYQLSLNACEDFTLANHSDWRFPTRKELMSLIRFDQYNPATVSDLFNQASEWFWTQDQTPDKKKAWAIHFFYGASYVRNLNYEYHVRPVRAGLQAHIQCFNIGMPFPGSQWVEGDLMNIQWQSCPSVETVSIYLSHSGGAPDSFTALARNYTNTGHLSWTVTGPQTNNAMIKIVSDDNPLVFDTQGMFRIIGQPLPMIALSPQTIHIPAKGGKAKITITNSGVGILEWQVNIFNDWIVPQSSLSGVENGGFEFLITENPDDSRTATIEISSINSGNSPQTVCVNQAGNEFINLFQSVSAGDLTETLESAWGCNWVDFNHDGWMDIFVINRHAKNSLYQNNKDRTFTRVMDHILVNTINDATAATWGDFDNDGDIDVFVVHPYEQNALYVNNGNGSFISIQDDIIVNDSGISYGASWVDANNDGYLDLYVTQTGVEPNALFMNQGNGLFEKNSIARITSIHGKSLAWGDYRQNGYMDVIIPEQVALFLNIGHLSFYRMETSVLNVDSSQNSFESAIWADFDNNTYMDLYLTHQQKNNVMLLNDGQEGFRQITGIPPCTDGGQAAHASCADFDRDGDIDLFVPRLDLNNLFYENNGNSQFTRINSGDVAVGNGRSSAVADYDNDGDMDLLVIGYDNYHILLENQAADSHWIAIRCIGSDANRSAIGAQVKVNAVIYGKTLQQTRQIVAQTGHSSMDSQIMLFGLGDQPLIDQIIVNWPGGNVSQLNQVISDQYITIIENDNANVKSLSISPGHQIVPALAGDLSFKVIVVNESKPLTWNAHSDNDWISFNGPHTGTQTQNLLITYDRNLGGQRTGSILIQADDHSISPVTLEIIQKRNAPPQWHFPIQELYLNEDDLPTEIAFEIQDHDTNISDLTFTIHSQDADLFSYLFVMPQPVTPNTMILSLTPKTNANGESIVSLAVSDGINQLTDTIWVKVFSVNDVPIVSGLEDLSTHEDIFVAQKFTVIDVDQDDISVHVQSLTPDLFDDQGIFIKAQGSMFRMEVKSIANKYGTGQLQFTISDGSASITQVINIEVQSVNDMPTMSDIVDQSLLESSIAVPFTVADVDTLAKDLIVDVKTFAPDLIPEDYLQLTGAGNDYTLTLGSPSNLFGIAQIELSVSDGFLTRTQKFNVFVRNAGNVPMIANIFDQQTSEDIPLYLTLTVGGVSSESIVITGTSNNTDVVRDTDITIQGIGQQRVLVITPIKDAFGETRIQLFVSDGNHTIHDEFLLNITPVNDPPIISEIENIRLHEDTDLKTVSFTISDIDSNHLSVIAVSSDDAIIPTNALDLNHVLDHWELSLMPVADATGACTIRVQVSDSLTTTVETFHVEMIQMNDTPVIQPIPDQIVDEDTPCTIFLSLSDEETPLTDLHLSVRSSNIDLLSLDNVTIDYHSITLTPTTNAFGKANITLSVDDGSGLPNAKQTETFVFWVRSVNDLPEILPIESQTVSESGSITLFFTINDHETPASGLMTQAFSDNQTLIPDRNLTIMGDESTRILKITPRPHYSGETQIHLSVFDGIATIFEAFTLTVLPYNYAPDFVIGMDLNIWEDAPPQKLIKWATQISPGPLNENKQIVYFEVTGNTHPEYFTGPPIVTAQGDLHYTLAEDAFGTAKITLNLFDDGFENNASTPKEFQIDILSVNDPPTFIKGQDIIIGEDKENCQFDKWAKSINPGAENESYQQLTFVLETDSPELFSQLPTVSDQGDLVFVPSPNANGIAQCQLYLKDNGDGHNTSHTEHFLIEILAENDPPTMTQIPDQQIFEDQPLMMELIIEDIDHPVSEILIDVTASQTVLFPNDAISITGSGTNRILEIMPSKNQSGESKITLTLSDGMDDSVYVFTLTVLAVNDLPVISPIEHQYLQEDSPAVFIPLTVTDVETAAEQIFLTAAANESNMFEFLDIQYISDQPFLHFQPTFNAFGTTSITVYAKDPDALDDCGTLDIYLTIAPIDDPPIIKASSPFEMIEDTVSLFDIEINDLDTDQSELFVNVQSGNSLIVPNDTNYLYIQGDEAMRSLHVKPYAEANGPVSLTITVSDLNNTSHKKIDLNIQAVNDPPIANDFRLDLIEDQVRKANFQTIDVDADPLTYTILSQGHLGYLTCLSDNSFMYTPYLNQFGIEQIQYQASDGQFVSNIGTIIVHISGINDMPKAHDLIFHVMEDRMMNGYLEGSDVDEDRLTYRIITPPQKGQMSITDERTGAFYYVPDMNACCQDTFTYKVYDGIIDSMTASVTMEITPVNDFPTVKASTLVINEDTSGSNQLEGSDIENDPLTYEKLSQQGTGTFVLMADGYYFYTPPANFNGTDTIIFRCFDGAAFSNMEQINITVKPVNDPPVAYADHLSINEDTIKQWQLSATDIDQDSLSFQIIDFPEAGSLTVLTSGWITYTPNNNYWGTDHFSFVADDGLALSEKAWITMTVMEVNDKPVVQKIPYNGLEDGTLSGKLESFDQEHDALTYSLTDLPEHGHFEFLENGEFTFYPESDFEGTDTFCVIANDGINDSDPTCLSLVILPVNDAPVSLAKTYTLNEDTLLNDFLIGMDIDNDALSYQLLSNGQLGTAQITNRQNGAFTYTPKSNQHGMDSLIFRVSDGIVNAIPSQLTFVIQSVNDAPVANNTQLNTNEDQRLKGQLSATDIDGDLMTYTIIEPSLKGDFSIINDSTGEFMYFPESNYYGNDQITFQVKDSHGELSNIARLDIGIQAMNDQPIAYSDTLIINEDQAVKSQLNGTDVDADIIWFIIEKKPAIGNIEIINAFSGTYLYTPFTDVSGMDAFQFFAYDGKEYSDPATIEIEIVNINDAPISQNITVDTMEDHPISSILPASDPDNDALTYEIIRFPYKGQIVLSSADGTYTYTPNKNENGSDTLTFKVNDGRKESAPSTVTFTIYPVNDAPYVKNLVLSCNLNEPLRSTLPIIDPDYQDGHDIQLKKWPENGTIKIINNGFEYLGFETGVDQFQYWVNDGYLTSNVAHVVILIGNNTINPDINGDGNIDLADAVMGLNALSGMNDADIALRDILFGLKFVSGDIR